MKTRRNWIATIATLGLLLPVAAVATPEMVCLAGKAQETGRYAACVSKAAAKYITKGDALKYLDTLGKCLSKLDSKFAKLEDKAVKKGGACFTAGDSAVMDAQTFHYLTVVGVLLGGAERFEANGDGTVSDILTGLMWETKNDNGGVRDKDNTYTWSATSPAMNGTAVTSFLSALNSPPCFAGYCDWRMPSVAELLELVDAAAASPKIAAVFNSSCTPGCTACSCTVAANHWTSTTNPSDAANAARVNFSTGFTGNASKTFASAVRAVRGGS